MTTYERNQHGMNMGPGIGGHRHPHPHYRQLKQAFTNRLSHCLVDYVNQLLPTKEELSVKDEVRKLLERLIRTIEPESRLLSFGSTANGFSLRNSDMDLCCLIDSEERLAASDLVTMVGDLLERETKFHVKPLPRARIPIIKLSLDSSPGLPLGIACDIGFENRLALENTRLLMCYAMVDPDRVRTMVLFLKVWSKRRKINSPYTGTLSSYGYVLLVIYFLVHVKNPPVLPNLQQIPPLRPMPPEEHHLGGRNIWFFDDTEILRQRWQSTNTESVAELLIDFFRYFSREFPYTTDVASIRAGLLKKADKGWQNDNDPRFKDARERNRFCIEDPFETDYNVARCVTRDGLYLIRGEFMRASRILASRSDPNVALCELVEESKEDEPRQMNSPQSYIPPRLSFPPLMPYTVGSNAFRPNVVPEHQRISPPRLTPKNSQPSNQQQQQTESRSPPEHMAPKRAKYTSPPPPEAPDIDHSTYENRLGLGLSLATAATEARQQDKKYPSSSRSNSETFSDDDKSPSDIAQEDDVRSEVHSVKSYAGETGGNLSTRTSFDMSVPSSVPHRYRELEDLPGPSEIALRGLMGNNSTPTPGTRGRRTYRPNNNFTTALPPVVPRSGYEFTYCYPKPEFGRRSASGPSRISNNGRIVPLQLQQVGVTTPLTIPLPPSPVRASISTSPTIYYETTTQSPSQSQSRRGSVFPSPVLPNTSPSVDPGCSPRLVGLGAGSSATSSPVKMFAGNDHMHYPFQRALQQQQQHQQLVGCLAAFSERRAKHSNAIAQPTQVYAEGLMHAHRQHSLQQQQLVESLAALSERRVSRQMTLPQVAASSSQMTATNCEPARQSPGQIQQSPNLSLTRNGSSHSHSHSSSTIVAPTTPHGHHFAHPVLITNVHQYQASALDTSSPTPSPAQTRFPHHFAQHRLSPNQSSALSSPLQQQHRAAELGSPANSSPRITGPSLLGLPSPTTSSHSSHSGTHSSSASPKSTDFGSPLSLSPLGTASNERSPAKASDGDGEHDHGIGSYRGPGVESTKFIGMKEPEKLPTVSIGGGKEDTSLDGKDGLLASVAKMGFSDAS